MGKPLFIQNLEYETSKFFSHLVVYENILISKLEEKKLTLIWLETEYQDDKLEIFDRIYKTQHSFYIYVMRNRLNKNYGEVHVYYEADQFKELKFFIKPFINSIKN